MKCIVGLGNPWKEYENTRHNVGFLIIDKLRLSLWFEDWKESKFKWVISEWVYHDQKILLVKPTTFMNLSGESVSRIANFYKLDPLCDILVISDDIDMEFAKVRFRKEWSHGGQNGLRDIIEKMGISTFSRIKIGIGRHEKYNVSDWVLSKFTKEEWLKIDDEIFLSVREKVENWLS